MVPPRAHHDRRLARRAQDRRVVAPPDRLAGGLHLARVGGAPAEEVGDDERAEAPALGIVARPSARGIELPLVRGARIEHEEVRRRLRFIPAPPQEVAPAAAGGEFRSGCATGYLRAPLQAASW